MKKILFITFLLFTLVNCTQKSNTDNFQNEVYSQIFHEIIDSCVVNIEPIELPSIIINVYNIVLNDQDLATLK